MSEPLVSVLIPCYNAAPWLAATLESALGQTWRRREIIVVDDGSRDASLAIARGFADRGVVVHAQPNRGAAAARNTALGLARGDLIQFLDADDLLAPDKLAHQVAALATADPATLAAGSWGRFQGDPASAVFNAEAVYQARTGIEFLQLHYETGSMMQPGAWLASRPLLDRAGPWDESLSLNDDGEYFSRVMLAARRLLFVPAARVYYRSSAGPSLSARVDTPALESLFRSVELTTNHLLAADASPRTRHACAYAWLVVALETSRRLPARSHEAERRSRQLGGSHRRLPGGRGFQWVARVLGWRAAARLFLR